MSRVVAVRALQALASWCLMICIPAYAASLDPASQARVRAATFEVVMKKPEQDSLTYEKPLPLHLLPYTERTDKYQSIGTAFAIGENRFVTAAHVLSAGFLTQFGPPAVRTSDGKVYEIAEVLKYAEHQDFAVFSLRGAPAVTPFEFNRKPTLDETVFAVGNALGEGIVVRDGLFTSETPEQRDGRWKWIRFSAAASPGNSGGPLLDKDGKVIGVVLGKSANENLNYAAPAAVVLDAPEGVAHLEQETGYLVPVMTARETGRLDADLKLPLAFAAFAQAVIQTQEAHYAKLRDELLRKNADTIFPRGAGSLPALNNKYTNDALTILGRKDDGTWEYHYPPQPQVTQLDNNGFVASSDMWGYTLFRIRRPDNAPVKDFYTDSELYGRTILKALSWDRPIGNEQIRIVSMGKAKSESQYVDSYGRKWQLRIWNVEFEDTYVLSMSLPTPDGLLSMVTWVDTPDREDRIQDMRMLASFSHVAYSGSLQQWDEFLALEDLLPRSFDDIRIERDYDKSFSFRSPRFEFGFSQAQQKVLPESQLRVGFGYFDDGRAVVWDVVGLAITEDLAARQGLFIGRHSKPPASLRQEYAVHWQKLTGREFPFNAQVIEDKGSSAITGIYPYPASEGAAPPRTVYQLAYVRPGKQEQAVMQAGLAAFLQGLKVKEE